MQLIIILHRQNIELVCGNGRVLPDAVVRGRKNPLHHAFSARFRRARRDSGLTLVDLAARASLAGGSVLLYLETGTRAPRLDTVEKLAYALGLSPAFLAYGLDGEPTLPDDKLRALGVAARLRTTRIEQDLSVLAVATAAGVSHTAVGNIERGTMPGLDTTEALAIALGVSPGWLGYGLGPRALPGRRRASESPAPSPG